MLTEGIGVVLTVIGTIFTMLFGLGIWLFRLMVKSNRKMELDMALMTRDLHEMRETFKKIEKFERELILQDGKLNEFKSDIKRNWDTLREIKTTTNH